MNEVAEYYLKDELYELIKTDDKIFSFIQDSALDGLWYWDLENMEEEWMNNKFWSTLGYDPNDMPHKASSWQDIINKEDLETALTNFQKHLEDPNHPYDQVVRYTHKDNSTVWIRCRGLAIRDKDGKPIRMLGAHTNITTTKQNEEALKDSLSLANERNDRLKNFAFIVSHNLKSHSINLKMLLEAFITENTELQNDDIVKMLTKSADKLNESIDHLADIINIQKQADLYLARVNLREAIETAIETQAMELEKHEIKWSIQVDSSLTVLGVEAYLESIFLNLISNCVKYFRKDADSYVSIYTNEIKDNMIEIVVEDNGLGIDLSKYRQKLFGMYKTFHNHENSKGIGLFITKNQIEAIGGSILAESEVNKGTKFILRFQRAD